MRLFDVTFLYHVRRRSERKECRSTFQVEARSIRSAVVKALGLFYRNGRERVQFHPIRERGYSFRGRVPLSQITILARRA